MSRQLPRSPRWPSRRWRSAITRSSSSSRRCGPPGALSVSLVAEIDGNVVGHVAFSPVTISDGNPYWYGLGPVSVLPRYQRRGIGTALINEGLSLLKAQGGQGCVLVGDPAYYSRLGFRNLPALTLEGVPPENFLALPFGEEPAQGAVIFHSAFSAGA